MKRYSIKRMSTLSMLVAAGILLQLIESFFCVVLIIPGYKVGLSNIVGLYALYAFGVKEMCIVNFLRIVLAGLCTGSLFSIGFYLSLWGGLFSLVAMMLAYKAKVFSIYGVSMAGAASHSIGQVIGVTIIYQQYFMQLFLPILLALSIVSGLCIGVITLQLLKRMEPLKAKWAT